MGNEALNRRMIIWQWICKLIFAKLNTGIPYTHANKGVVRSIKLTG